MNYNNLTLYSARIFLNTFGFILENVNDINEFSTIKIFDQKKNQVGHLYFNNGQVNMVANYNDNILNANCDIVKINRCVDDTDGTITAVWNSSINFVNNTNTLSGRFIINNSIDSQYSIHCTCHPLICYNLPEKGNIILIIHNSNSIFDLQIITKDSTEIIDIRPITLEGTFFKHDFKRSKYDQDGNKYSYRKYAVLSHYSNKDDLHVYMEEQEHDKILSFRNEFIPKLGNNNCKEDSIKRGILMQQLDPDMFKKIEQLRQILKIGDISLLDNLISVCYDNYTDEEVNALLGLQRKLMNYQGGYDNLVQAYYEMDKDSCLLPSDVQKKFLKKGIL